MHPAPLRTRRVQILTIHVPVAAETLRRLMAGDSAAIDAEPALSTILAIVRESDSLGAFGAYRGVVELGLGWECFTPGGSARPALGTVGVESRSPTVILRIHMPAEDRAQADAAIADILAAHPWEIPVIECSTAEILVR